MDHPYAARVGGGGGRMWKTQLGKVKKTYIAGSSETQVFNKTRSVF